jgi:pimeloyl-ACP methyl ester carboxylesterase
MVACAVAVAETRAQDASKPTSEDIVLTAKDGWEIKITYYKSPAGQESPVVVMLHGKTGNRMVWKSFAEILQTKAQFAVITVDLRGHGESIGGGGGSGKKPSGGAKAIDYLGMIAGDMEAVKKFIYDENQNKNLNMNKLAIVAADMSTPVAVEYMVVDWDKAPYDDAPTVDLQTPRGQDVQALALLSPESSAPGLQVTKSLGIVRALKRPALIAVGTKNASDLKEAKKVHEALAPKNSDSQHIVYKDYPVNLRGTDLIGKNLKMEEDLFNFLFENVKSLKGTWRDRKSKLLD